MNSISQGRIFMGMFCLDSTSLDLQREDPFFSNFGYMASRTWNVMEQVGARGARVSIFCVKNLDLVRKVLLEVLGNDFLTICFFFQKIFLHFALLPS